jgi:hypothetical protein
MSYYQSPAFFQKQKDQFWFVLFLLLVAGAIYLIN